MRFEIQNWCHTQWISIRFVSFSTGKGYQLQWSTSNLLQSSIMVQSSTRMLQNISGDCSGLRTKKRDQYQGPDIIDQAIWTTLDEYLFSSMHKISKRTYIAVTTVCWWLTNFIGFVVKYLRWSFTHWVMQNGQQGWKCQTNSWQSSVRLNTKGDNISSPLMNCVLFIDRLRNHLIIGWRITSQNSETSEIEKHMIQTR
jgi:hypothetical protein